MNEQRKVIYRRRNQIIEGEDLHDETIEVLESTITELVASSCPSDFPEEWDLARLVTEVTQYYPTKFVADDLAGATTVGQVTESILTEALGLYAERDETIPGGEETARQLERDVYKRQLLTLSRLGIIPDAAAALAGVGTSLSRRRDALVGPGGPAEEVARLIGRTIPLIYGSEGLTAVAARRWKTQINENAKTPAFFAVQPELSHNEVAGWGQNGDVTRQVLSLVTLRHAGEHPQVCLLYTSRCV